MILNISVSFVYGEVPEEFHSLLAHGNCLHGSLSRLATRIVTHTLSDGKNRDEKGTEHGRTISDCMDTG